VYGCCCCCVRERKLVVLWREVEIRNRKQQGKYKTNGEINEKTKHKRQRELNRQCRMSQHFDDSSIYF
jgi:hypothetical protein